MGSLVVGFDSAWTPTNAGAIVGTFIDDTGAVHELGLPRLVRYAEAGNIVNDWRSAHSPSLTVVLIDQPTIVENLRGQRPVERIVSSAISRRRSGMQPANRGRVEMFGDEAPIWEFVQRFGGVTAPYDGGTSTRVIETYPVLAMISLGWVLPDSQRPAGRLPKYNPERKNTFAMADWVHVCRAAAAQLRIEGAAELSTWLDSMARHPKPTKSDQDRLDACICLISALHLAKGGEGLFIGSCLSGYIVVPDAESLRNELATRCRRLNYVATDWMRVFRLDADVAT